ncbi:MAG: 1-acyl-sn-glycerol-3-phosphate acyltransferase [Acidobacteria bacterium]|nr:1-acyl-sn-glycerol-3-phosphate acyltransferase [Acidobacteriota bacterium]|tara:strand:+ start:708 stop:1460 length:753 start_codon:yes stop_codon:yes gene_type:complete
MLGSVYTVIAGVRSIAAYLLVSLYVVIVAPPGIVWALVTKRSRALYWLGRQGVRLGLFLAGIRYRVAGAEYVQSGRPSVYCVNHTSNLEPPVLFMVLQAVHPKLRILYKAEIHKLPLLSTVFDIAGFVPIQRLNREQSRTAIEKAASALRSGDSFLIFPEGTRSRTGVLLPFKKGGFVMAVRGGGAIVPLTIFGTRKAMRRGSPIIRPVVVSVRIGKPINPNDFGVDRRDDLVRATRRSMEELLAAGPLA